MSPESSDAHPIGVESSAEYQRPRHHPGTLRASRRRPVAAPGARTERRDPVRDAA